MFHNLLHYQSTKHSSQILFKKKNHEGQRSMCFPHRCLPKANNESVDGRQTSSSTTSSSSSYGVVFYHYGGKYVQKHSNSIPTHFLKSSSLKAPHQHNILQLSRKRKRKGKRKRKEHWFSNDPLRTDKIVS